MIMLSPHACMLAPGLGYLTCHNAVMYDSPLQHNLRTGFTVLVLSLPAEAP